MRWYKVYGRNKVNGGGVCHPEGSMVHLAQEDLEFLAEMGVTPVIAQASPAAPAGHQTYILDKRLQEALNSHGRRFGCTAAFGECVPVPLFKSPLPPAPVTPVVVISLEAVIPTGSYIMRPMCSGTPTNWYANDGMAQVGQRGRPVGALCTGYGGRAMAPGQANNPNYSDVPQWMLAGGPARGAANSDTDYTGSSSVWDASSTDALTFVRCLSIVKSVYIGSNGKKYMMSGLSYPYEQKQAPGDTLSNIFPWNGSDFFLSGAAIWHIQNYEIEESGKTVTYVTIRNRLTGGYLVHVEDGGFSGSGGGNITVPTSDAEAAAERAQNLSVFQTAESKYKTQLSEYDKALEERNSGSFSSVGSKLGLFSVPKTVEIPLPPEPELPRTQGYIGRCHDNEMPAYPGSGGAYCISTSVRCIAPGKRCCKAIERWDSFIDGSALWRPFRRGTVPAYVPPDDKAMGAAASDSYYFVNKKTSGTKGVLTLWSTDARYRVLTESNNFDQAPANFVLDPVPESALWSGCMLSNRIPLTFADAKRLYYSAAPFGPAVPPNQPSADSVILPSSLRTEVVANMKKLTESKISTLTVEEKWCIPFRRSGAAGRLQAADRARACLLLRSLCQVSCEIYRAQLGNAISWAAGIVRSQLTERRTDEFVGGRYPGVGIAHLACLSVSTGYVGRSLGPFSPIGPWLTKDTGASVGITLYWGRQFFIKDIKASWVSPGTVRLYAVTRAADGSSVVEATPFSQELPSPTEVFVQTMDPSTAVVGLLIVFVKSTKQADRHYTTFGFNGMQVTAAPEPPAAPLQQSVPFYPADGTLATLYGGGNNRRLMGKKLFGGRTARVACAPPAPSPSEDPSSDPGSGSYPNPDETYTSSSEPLTGAEAAEAAASVSSGGTAGGSGASQGEVEGRDAFWQGLLTLIPTAVGAIMSQGSGQSGAPPAAAQVGGVDGLSQLFLLLFVFRHLADIHARTREIIQNARFTWREELGTTPEMRERSQPPAETEDWNPSAVAIGATAPIPQVGPWGHLPVATPSEVLLPTNPDYNALTPQAFGFPPDFSPADSPSDSALVWGSGGIPAAMLNAQTTPSMLSPLLSALLNPWSTIASGGSGSSLVSQASGPNGALVGWAPNVGVYLNEQHLSGSSSEWQGSAEGGGYTHAYTASATVTAYLGEMVDYFSSLYLYVLCILQSTGAGGNLQAAVAHVHASLNSGAGLPWGINTYGPVVRTADPSLPPVSAGPRVIIEEDRFGEATGHPGGAAPSPLGPGEITDGGALFFQTMYQTLYQPNSNPTPFGNDMMGFLSALNSVIQTNPGSAQSAQAPSDFYPIFTGVMNSIQFGMWNDAVGGLLDTSAVQASAALALIVNPGTSDEASANPWSASQGLPPNGAGSRDGPANADGSVPDLHAQRSLAGFDGGPRRAWRRTESQQRCVCFRPSEPRHPE